MITRTVFFACCFVKLFWNDSVHRKRQKKKKQKKKNELSQEAPGSETWNKHGLSDDIYEKIIAACNAVWMNVASCYLMYGES